MVKNGFKAAIRMRIFMVCQLLLGGLLFCAPGGSSFSESYAGFMITCDTITIPYSVFAIYVLPGQTITLKALDIRDRRFFARFQDLPLASSRRNTWRFTAPAKTGLFRFAVRDSQRTDSILVNCFVMVPFSQCVKGFVNTYRIGRYPSVKDSAYRPPAGFIEVTEGNQDAAVSPHFAIRDFVCKQDRAFPRYVVLREQLPLKLELILSQLNKKGYHCATLGIMSGYRTPYYNTLTRHVPYSRHIWGDAADIFIDRNGDGQIDDLNGDGTSDLRDARIMFTVIRDLRIPAWCGPVSGGLAAYDKGTCNTAFIHVDCRGTDVYWGDIAAGTKRGPKTLPDGD
jgi:hypothetical protein